MKDKVYEYMLEVRKRKRDRLGQKTAWGNRAVDRLFDDILLEVYQEMIEGIKPQRKENTDAQKSKGKSRLSSKTS